ncbi:MAG: type II toxin-antitoxin system RelE/ParE family toxin [Candidatus Thermoplasmatota archaeon]|nr:type II toxin-antitoxin system RelE/ParE family toxin [Candidatus Thermoplasmatota archaeon]
MTKYEVLVSQTARKQLEALDKGTRARIKRALRNIDPSRSTVKRLKGPKRDYFRLRVGEYRVMFTVEGKRVLVVRILHRRVAYSWVD